MFLRNLKNKTKSSIVKVYYFLIIKGFLSLFGSIILRLIIEKLSLKSSHTHAKIKIIICFLASSWVRFFKNDAAGLWDLQYLFTLQFRYWEHFILVFLHYDVSLHRIVLILLFFVYLVWTSILNLSRIYFSHFIYFYSK